MKKFYVKITIIEAHTSTMRGVKIGGGEREREIIGRLLSIIKVLQFPACFLQLSFICWLGEIILSQYYHKAKIAENDTSSTSQL